MTFFHFGPSSDIPTDNTIMNLDFITLEHASTASIARNNKKGICKVLILYDGIMVYHFSMPAFFTPLFVNLTHIL